MNVEIGTETPIFLFWEYLFQIFGILSLQCGVDSMNKNSLALSDSDGYGSGPCWIGSIQNKDQEPPMKNALQKACLQCFLSWLKFNLYTNR